MYKENKEGKVRNLKLFIWWILDRPKTYNGEKLLVAWAFIFINGVNPGIVNSIFAQSRDHKILIFKLRFYEFVWKINTKNVSLLFYFLNKKLEFI